MRRASARCLWPHELRVRATRRGASRLTHSRTPKQSNHTMCTRACSMADAAHARDPAQRDGFTNAPHRGASTWPPIVACKRKKDSARCARAPAAEQMRRGGGGSRAESSARAGSQCSGSTSSRHETRRRQPLDARRVHEGKGHHAVGAKPAAWQRLRRGRRETRLQSPAAARAAAAGGMARRPQARGTRRSKLSNASRTQ